MTFVATESERVYRKAEERAFRLASEMQKCHRAKNTQTDKTSHSVVL